MSVPMGGSSGLQSWPPDVTRRRAGPGPGPVGPCTERTRARDGRSLNAEGQCIMGNGHMEIPLLYYEVATESNLERFSLH